MKLAFRIRRSLLEEIHADLSTPHPFAAERVGFLACKAASLPEKGVMLCASRYLPVLDDDYEDDASVGAMLGAGAFRQALQYCYQERSAMFHIHRHEHNGMPRFSYTDISEARRFVPDFWKVQKDLPHGTLVLSYDSIFGLCWHPLLSAPTKFDEYLIAGFPTTKISGTYDHSN